MTESGRGGERSQSTETTLAEIGEIGDGMEGRRERERRVLGVIIRVKYAADIVIIFFRDRMIG